MATNATRKNKIKTFGNANSFVMVLLCIFTSSFLTKSGFAQDSETVGSASTGNPVYSSYFRAGHSLSLLFAFQQTNWKIERAGAVDEVRAQSFAPGYSLRYAFHFSLFHNFGMLVGTSVQTSFESREYQGFNPGIGFIFPSMAGGFVVALAPRLRASFSTEYAAAWYPWMRTSVEQKDAANGTSTLDIAKVGLIPDMISMFNQWDYFYSNTRAFSWTVGWRSVWNSCVKGLVNTNECGDNATADKSLVERIRLDNSGFFIQIGASWQPGDEL